MLIALILPDWLVSEKYLTLATWGLVLCTFLLVVVTFVLWWDSLQKGKEQRERWKREDLREAQSRKPQFQFGLKRRPIKSFGLSLDMTVPNPAAYLWVANLASSGLYIENLLIQHRDFGTGSLEVNQIVKAGDQLQFDISDTFWQQIPGIRTPSDGNYLYGDHEVWLKLADSTNHFESDRFLYNIVYMQRSFADLQRGSHERRQPTCPKCGHRLNSLLIPGGFATEQEVQEKQWKPILEDLVKTCPNHASVFLKEINV